MFRIKVVDHHEYNVCRHGLKEIFGAIFRENLKTWGKWYFRLRVFPPPESGQVQFQLPTFFFSFVSSFFWLRRLQQQDDLKDKNLYGIIIMSANRTHVTHGTDYYRGHLQTTTTCARNSDILQLTCMYGPIDCPLLRFILLLFVFTKWLWKKEQGIPWTRNEKPLQ